MEAAEVTPETTDMNNEALESTTDARGGCSARRVVRRFVVQECDPRHKAYGWYDDPSCDECETLLAAKGQLESDTECVGHARLYKHQIIERTERVVFSPHNRTERPEADTH